ncbi:MAG: FAD-dependent oxidoreductase [Actinomycetota bacterium]
MSATVVTLNGTTVELDDDALDELRKGFRGYVLVPGDPAEAEVRPAFNLMHQGRPGLTVRCWGTADVAAAVKFASDRDLLVAVRGGGHSIAGLSTVEGGLLIDLSAMSGVSVDPARKLAHVQGGALLGDVDRETQVFGLATPLGVVSGTGVAGLTLGGGYGWLRRKHGLACDNLVEAQVVGADGQVHTASAENNEDLFWAIRGGGGNFGIVTVFSYQLHDVGPIVAFAAPIYALEDAPSILRGWREFLASAPNEVTSLAVVLTFPPVPDLPEVLHNRACLIVGGVYAGDLEEATAALRPLRELGTPLVDLSAPEPFTQVQSGFDPFFPRLHFHSYWKSQFVNDLSDEVIDTFVELASDRPQPLSSLEIWQMGGAVSDVGDEETPISGRSAQFLVSIGGNWTEAAMTDEVVGWVRSTWSRIKEFGTGDVYLNFTGLSEEAPSAGVDTAYGRNLRRLAEIKAKYDPANFFRLNNNIAPVKEPSATT